VRYPLALLALVGWLTIVGFWLDGCHDQPPPETITETTENAAAVAQYKLLLSDCRKKAVDAGNIAVFDKCADELDAELCRTRALRCLGGAK